MARKISRDDSNGASKKLRTYLRDARMKKGHSQAALAEILGYESAQYISDWERGVSSPPMKKLGKIVDTLGLDLEELFDLLLEVAKERVTGDLTREFSRIRSKKKR